MELEFGLKITKTMDDLTSFADFQIAKDRAGPVFLSREDDNLFILTVHLKGFKKENIDIKINEDGTRITVHGEKLVQQTVMIGWTVPKTWMELKVLSKVFKIPDGVVLDRIKAKFNKEESILTIIMPKREKGIRGVGIEEVKEEEVGREMGKSKRVQVVANEVPKKDKGVEIQEEYKEPEIKRMEESKRVVEKEMDRGGSEKTKNVEEVAGKDIIGDRIHEESKEPKVPHQIAKEEADKGGLEATKPVAEELPKKEYIGKTLPEKTEEPKVEKTEETDGVVKEKFGGEKPETIADKELKREKEAREPASKLAEETQQVAETSEKTKEIKPQRQIGEAAPKMVEPPVPTTKHPEVATMKPRVTKPGNETDRPRTKEQPPPIEETWSKELPVLPEQRKKQEIPEVQKVEQKGMEEETSTKDEFRQAEHNMPQEPQKQVSHIDVKDSTKSKTDQELEQAETPQLQYPVEQHGKDEVTEQEKTYSIGNEIEEASNERSSQEKEGESPEAEKQKDLGEGATQEKKPASKKCKLCAPCVVGGSAILVAIIAFVVHMIRTKKR